MEYQKKQMEDNSRSPLGERGLKYRLESLYRCSWPSRSPLGERGLKFLMQSEITVYDMSLSAWRAWIEIKMMISTSDKSIVALRLESVD